MAKRFIDTDLFRKPFMRSLEAPYKALWIYLLCECDHAGVWVVELDVAQIRMGLKLDPEKVIEKMGGAVVSVDGGSKWYLPDFVAFQYGTLNPENRVHASVLSRLEALGIDPEKKPLASPLQGAKDKDKDKDTQEKKERASEVLTWPSWAGPQTKAKWQEFITYRIREHKQRYKSTDTEQKALNLAAKYFPSGPMFVEALEHSMAKGWRFPVDPSEHKYPFSAPVKSDAPIRVHKDMTRSEAKAVLDQIRVDRGIPPGGLVETQFIPQEVRDAMQR
jgi:hypothetical protein